MKKFLQKLKKTKPSIRPHSIGPHTIFLPHDHRLDEFQKKFPRLDYALGEISRIIYQHNPDFTAIDIGANVGDTAALLCKYNKIPVLCIEGVPKFLTLLKKNADIIGDNIIIEPSFVGSGKETISTDLTAVKGGTYSIEKSDDSTGVKTLRLVDILKKHPDFSNSLLLKIDTDGFDFNILLNSADLLEQMQPILFWEHDICFKTNDSQEAEKTLQKLASIGYHYFIVYDNFGNYLISLEGIEKFEDLHLYLLSNKTHARNIFYFDICAFIPSKHEALYRAICAFEHAQKSVFLEQAFLTGV